MKRQLNIALIGLMVLIGGYFNQVQAQQYTETEIKAVFLYNFLKFVEWPASASKTSEVVIGFLGDSPFSPALERIVTNRSVNGKKVVVRYYSNTIDAREAHLLFINAQYADQTAAVTKMLTAYPILTVSEMSQFCQKGGMINFTKIDHKYGFEINVFAAESVGIKVSSRLVALGRVVSTN